MIRQILIEGLLWYLKDSKAGVEYRKSCWEKKYENPDPWHSISNKEKTYPLFGTAGREYLQSVKEFKNKYQYWKSWTGARWVIEENPNNKNQKTCIKNPVSGLWSPL